MRFEMDEKWVGVQLEGTNCWEFLVRFYKEELGIRIQNFGGRLRGTEDKIALSRFLNDYLNSDAWVMVEEPRYPDIVMYKVKGRLLHGGIMLGKTAMLHLRLFGSCIQDVHDEKIWGRKQAVFHGYYRLKGDLDEEGHSLLHGQ